MENKLRDELTREDIIKLVEPATLSEKELLQTVIEVYGTTSPREIRYRVASKTDYPKPARDKLKRKLDQIIDNDPGSVSF
jgi:aromatic ring hydroxylase